MVSPGDFCHSLWQFLIRGPRGLVRWVGFVESPHAPEVPCRKATDSRKACRQVMCEPVDHRRAPPRLLLTDRDVPPREPVHAEHFAVRRKCGSDLSRLNPALDDIEETRVIP